MCVLQNRMWTSNSPVTQTILRVSLFAWGSGSSIRLPAEIVVRTRIALP